MVVPNGFYTYFQMIFMIFKEGVLDVASLKLPRAVVIVGLPQVRIKVLKRCSFSLNGGKLDVTHISN